MLWTPQAENDALIKWRVLLASFSQGFGSVLANVNLAMWFIFKPPAAAITIIAKWNEDIARYASSVANDIGRLLQTFDMFLCLAEIKLSDAHGYLLRNRIGRTRPDSRAAMVAAKPPVME